MNIRCMIVDDEPLAREGMERLVNDTGIFELVATCNNSLEANKILSHEKIDLMFLDIQMPGMRGIDFLKTLQIRPLVIITTAYPNFALEGFELNVLDYLVKPITPERFLRLTGPKSFWNLKEMKTLLIKKISFLSGRPVILKRYFSATFYLLKRLRII